MKSKQRQDFIQAHCRFDCAKFFYILDFYSYSFYLGIPNTLLLF